MSTLKLVSNACFLKPEGKHSSRDDDPGYDDTDPGQDFDHVINTADQPLRPLESDNPGAFYIILEEVPKKAYIHPEAPGVN